MTKHFKNTCAQGDVMFIRLTEEDCKKLFGTRRLKNFPKVLPSDGVHILAHSETGHHHVMEAVRDGQEIVEMYRLPESIYECFIVVKEPTELKHLRDYDTHETIAFEPGTYKVLGQREYVPGEQARRVED